MKQQAQPTSEGTYPGDGHSHQFAPCPWNTSAAYGQTLTGKSSEVFEHTQLWDSYVESTQLLMPGAARSQPSLEGERGRLVTLALFLSEDGSSDTELSFRAVAVSCSSAAGLCSNRGTVWGCGWGKAGSPAPEPLYLGESTSQHSYHHFPPSSLIGPGRAVQTFTGSRTQRKEEACSK